jgi:hypothetical protein
MSVDLIDEFGIVASHPAREAQPLRAAPTQEKQFNTFELDLTPVACMSLNDILFAFDSSFVQPEINRLLPLLPGLRESHKTPQGKLPLVSIFGHADPVGEYNRNSHLSARRARALYGLLTRNVDIWMDLFKANDWDKWGLTSTEIMLSGLKRKPKNPDGSLGDRPRMSDDSAPSYYTGALGEAWSAELDRAIKNFQDDEGMTHDGVMRDPVRKKMFELYMDAITGSSTPMMQPSQFLGHPDGKATGTDKAAYQGCGEYNPVLIFSKQQEKDYQKAGMKEARDSANAPNRRAMMFFFRETDFSPVTMEDIRGNWPCPAWKDGNKGCSEQFWGSGKERLAAGDNERKYADGERTMACHWYDRWARLSPCENAADSAFVVWDDALFGPATGATIRVEYADGSYLDVTADSHGGMSVPLRSPRVTLHRTTNHGTLSVVVFIAPPSVSTDTGAWQRLFNLGYCTAQDAPVQPPTPGALRSALQEFQADHALDVSGDLDGQTRTALVRAHDRDRRPWRARDWIPAPSPGPNPPRPKSRLV